MSRQLVICAGLLGLLAVRPASAQEQTETTEVQGEAAEAEGEAPRPAEAGNGEEAAQETGAVDRDLEAVEEVRPEDEKRPAGTAEAEAVSPEEGEAAETEAEEAGEEEEVDSSLAVGGALRFNYFVKTWPGEEQNRERGGDMAFDTFRLNVDAAYDGLVLSAEYRFYAGYQMLHHGYMGYQFSDRLELDLGVSRAPFGILPYASHNWFFDLTYYVGLEDDYDLGALVTWKPLDALDVRAAFYKNDEGNYTGSSVDSARYSYDIVRTTPEELGYAGVTNPRNNVETNEFDLRIAWLLDHGDLGSTELGASGQFGWLHNLDTDDFGTRWAAAGHVNSTVGALNVMLEAARYEIAPANPAGVPDDFVVMGAYDAPYKVASAGWVFVANVSWKVPVTWGPIESLTFYNDYSHILKDEDAFADSQQDVVGVLVTAGPIYTYVDAALGRNHPWLGPDYGIALAEGDPDADWHARFNVNLGWYF